jgi:hypothetical protein
MATMKVMRRIFDVLRRDRQLAAANIVRSCPDDCDIRPRKIKQQRYCAPRRPSGSIHKRQ